MTDRLKKPGSPSGVASAGATEWPEIEQALSRREAAKVYQLALWPDKKRAMPTEFVRSALFAAIQGKDSTYLERVEIANANDLSIIYTGHRLTQVHADVWEGIMHLARGVPESTVVTFRAREFLRLIGRHTGKRQRDELRLWWAHLTATCVEVHDKKNGRRFFGSLIPRGAERQEDDDTLYVVELNRAIASLFERGFSTVDWEQRKMLLKKPLCLWLQHHFSAFPKPITVKTLHTLTGSNAQHLRQFRAKLKVALAELRAVGVLAEWRIDDETLHVTLPSRPLPKASLKGPPSRAAVASSPQRSLAGVLQAAIAPETLVMFRNLYPTLEVDHCLNDWLEWPGSRRAKNPDGAFLGFAKKWAAEKLQQPQG
jgi:TrfA protein